MEKNFFKIISLLTLTYLCSCTSNIPSSELKFYGEKSLDINGDTVFYKVPEFSFMDQDSNIIGNKTVEKKVYVTDFFFTTCPTICPRMKDQMIRVYNEFKGDSNVKIISHTIDPQHDTIPLLNDFAYNKLEIEKGIWHFVTGEKDVIYDMAFKYMVTAGEDGTEPGGYVHSGKFILVDKNGHIRGFYDGTDPLDVSDLMRDMKTLLSDKN